MRIAIGIILAIAVTIFYVGAPRIAEAQGDHPSGKAEHPGAKKAEHPGSKAEHPGGKAEHPGSVGALKSKGSLKAQETCPVLNKPIDKKLYVDANGVRIYVCCAGCVAKVKADPAKAIAVLASKGEQPEALLVVCPKCGEIKGAKNCCAKDAVKCAKCGLNKDAVGCCKHLQPTKKGADIVLCPKCGNVKGAKQCCAKDAVKCAKCGLAKDSPGCCKLPAALKAPVKAPAIEKAPAVKGALKPQASCPIMGGKINKKLFVDAGGYRFYVCCPGCLAPIKKDPAKALAALRAKGEEPERAP